MPQPRHRATTHHTAACSPGSVQALRLGKKHYPAAAPTLPPAVPPTPTNTPMAPATEPLPPALPTCCSSTLRPEIADIPRHRFVNAFHDGVSRGIAEQTLAFTNISLRVAHIAGTKVAIGRRFSVIHPLLRQRLAQILKQLVQRGAPTHRDVVNLTLGLLTSRSGQQVGLDSILDIAEVAAGLTVTIDKQRCMAPAQVGITAA